MRTIAIVLGIAFILPTLGCSPGLNDGAVLWRGFNHKWEYNHRLGRMGDRLSARSCGNGEASCGAFALHSSASGTESDRIDFTTWFTRVLASEVAFAGVDVSHELGARNSGLVERYGEEVRLSIDDFPNLANRDHYAVILGGFDIRSLGPDDKLALLHLDAGTARWDDRAGDVEVEYGLALSMDCPTDAPDCEDNFFSYAVDLSLMVVAWDGEDVALTEEELSKTDLWDAPPWCVNDQGELDGTDCDRLGDGENESARVQELNRITRTIRGTAGTTTAFLAFKSVMVDLGDLGDAEAYEAHRIAAMRMAIRDAEHDPSSGAYTYTLDQIFLNWHRDRDGLDGAASFAYPTTGAATWTTELSLFQLFVYAQIDEGEFNGEMDWSGGEYDSPDAERWSSLEFSQQGF